MEKRQDSEAEKAENPTTSESQKFIRIPPKKHLKSIGLGICLRCPVQVPAPMVAGPQSQAKPSTEALELPPWALKKRDSSEGDSETQRIARLGNLCIVSMTILVYINTYIISMH